MVVDDQEPGAGRCRDRDRSALAAEAARRRESLDARLLGGERHRNARAQALVLVTWIVPPISSISWREMASPRPVPP